MRYVAHISQLPKTTVSSFWDDVRHTERWLRSLGKEVASRQLTLGARSLRQLNAWQGWQQGPLVLEGWFDPMSVELTWRYLIEFLADWGPHSIRIPCGGDAEVRWSQRHLTIRAPHLSWVWQKIEESWELSQWERQDLTEWHETAHPYRAWRMPWGYVQQSSPSTYWNEWDFYADAGFEPMIGKLWSALAVRLGSRSMRVLWHQETLPRSELLLGLPIHLIQAGMSIVNPPSLFWESSVLRVPALRGLRCNMSWEVPDWSPYWANTVFLRRWRQATRLEAHYRARLGQNWDMSAHRSLRHERRSVPVFAWTATQSPGTGGSWEHLQQRAADHGRLDALAKSLSVRKWPGAPTMWPVRLRYSRSQWHIEMLQSDTGKWVISHRQGPQIVIGWPRHSHPGWLLVKWPDTLGSGLEVLDPEQHLDTTNTDWRYWAWLVTEHLMPDIERWLRSANGLAIRNIGP